MDIMSVVKEHPIPIGIGVVVILLIVFSRGSNGATSSNAGAFLQAQSIAAQSNNQLAEITMRGNIALGQQSVERNHIAMDAATARTGAVAGLFATMVGTNAQVRMNADNNGVKTQQLMLNSNANMLETNAQLAIAKETIAGGIKANADKLAAQIRMGENDNGFKLSAIGAQTSGNLALMQKRGELDAAATAQNINFQKWGIDKNYEFQDKLMTANATTLPALLQHQINMAKIQGDQEYQRLSITTAADRTMANANARNKDADTGGDWISNIAKLFVMFG